VGANLDMNLDGLVVDRSAQLPPWRFSVRGAPPDSDDRRSDGTPVIVEGSVRVARVAATSSNVEDDEIALRDLDVLLGVACFTAPGEPR
jgi:hypothetical protein